MAGLDEAGVLHVIQKSDLLRPMFVASEDNTLSAGKSNTDLITVDTILWAVCNRWTGLLDWTTGTDLCTQISLRMRSPNAHMWTFRMSGTPFSPIAIALSSDDDSPVVIEIKDSPVKLVVSPPYKYVCVYRYRIFYYASI